MDRGWGYLGYDIAYNFTVAMLSLVIVIARKFKISAQLESALYLVYVLILQYMGVSKGKLPLSQFCCALCKIP